ncbi:MAG: right-handed parallel beta-helix repeat-containing protein [Aquabacterium sp.]
MTYYVDGASGSDANDGRSDARPRRTLSQLNLQSVTVLLRRGTTIEMRTSVFPVNLVLDAYGSGAKPILSVPTGATAGIVPSTGEIVVRNVVFRGNPADMSSNSAVGGGKASRVVVEDCEFDYFANAVTFSGANGVIQRNRISNMSNNGLYGGKWGYPAPSNYLISENVIDATGTANDAITLHDGDGIGEGNRILNNRLWGARENAVDVLGQFRATTIQGNTIGSNGLAGIIVSRNTGSATGGEGTIIADNVFTGSSNTAIYARVNGATITRNRIANLSSTSLASAIAVSGPADITDNTISVTSASTRPVITLIQTAGLPSPTGTILRNSIDNGSSQQLFGVIVASDTADQLVSRWNIDQNAYRVNTSNVGWFFGLSLSAWRSRNWGGSFPFKDQGAQMTVVNQ